MRHLPIGVSSGAIVGEDADATLGVFVASASRRRHHGVWYADGVFKCYTAKTVPVQTKPTSVG
ncbi:MAG: hypothetical protein NZ874_07495 [Fimbriimonadales bacterium]|nr:hypothetical protein [Fimbriimonadales bacterium]